MRSVESTSLAPEVFLLAFMIPVAAPYVTTR